MNTRQVPAGRSGTASFEIRGSNEDVSGYFYRAVYLIELIGFFAIAIRGY